MNRHERRRRTVLQRKNFPHIGIGAAVVYIDRKGGNAPHEMRVVARCHLCGCAAIVPLPPPLLAEQTDETTHVCLPQIGGCNTGFTYEAAAAFAEMPEESEGPASET